MTSYHKPNETIDARGMLCPLPVLKLRKHLKKMKDGGVVELWSDDPAAIVDVQHFCIEAGQEFLGMTEMEGYQAFCIKKSSKER